MQMEFLEEGSDDCPLIRLIAVDNDDLRALVVLIERLETGAVRELHLHDEPFVRTIDGCRLTLRVAERNVGIRRLGSDRRFLWELSTDGWVGVNDRADALADAGEFQWLDETGPISLLLTKTGRW